MKPPAVTQAALTASILASVGVPAHESFEVEVPDDAFAHQRVVEFDPAQFAGGGPDESLSDDAVRWRDPAAALPDTIRRFIAPDVPANCGRFVEYALYHYGDGFLSLDPPFEGGRAVERDFPTLRNPPHQLVTQRIADRGLTLEIDEDAGCLGPGWQRAKVAALRGALDRARLRRTVALFVAGAVRVGRTWDAGSDPDVEVREELDAQPLRATRVVYDPRAWARRGRALRARQADGGSLSTDLSMEELAGEFSVDEVQVIRANAAAKPAADGPCAGGQILLFCAADRLGRNDFSNLKTFTAPAKTGGRYAAHVCRVSGKRWRLGVECHETVAITSTVGLGVITIG